MIRTSLRKLSASDINRFACDGERFVAASMSGMPGAHWNTGRMPTELAARYNANSAQIHYTVLSYGTPIAWLENDGWVVPEEGYSATTKTRHQPIVRQLFPRA